LFKSGLRHFACKMRKLDGTPSKHCGIFFCFFFARSLATIQGSRGVREHLKEPPHTTTIMHAGTIIGSSVPVLAAVPVLA
jgi:hypothetical protein